ncbi:MAG: TetR/AcrR family transcriptional regulator [Bradymonadia bacterium]
MSKGAETRDTILARAMDLGSTVGLVGLTIGELAKQVGMSKSGLYAHFNSKEDLQRSVLEAAAAHFTARVLRPAIQAPRGEPRVRALFDRWMAWSSTDLKGGCLFITASIEFDDRDTVVRSYVKRRVQETQQVIARAAEIAVEEGHFDAQLDVGSFAFEFWGILLSFHNYSRLLDDASAREKALGALEALILRARPST